MNEMQTRLAGLIVESVQEIFSAYLFLEVVSGPAKAKPVEDPYSPPDAEVLAIVGYKGGLNGGMHLASPEHVACQLSGAFAGVELDSMDGEGIDAFGELANLVAGGVQTRLMEGHGFGEITLTPPLVSVKGETHANYRDDLQSVQQYFKFAGGLLFAECFYLNP